MVSKLSRRRAVGLFSLAGARLMIGCGGRDGAGAGQKVLVLGAGLAGLAAAYELQKAGFEVTVLEGRERVGGRVYTVRDGLQGGQHAEMGAVRIASVHEETIHYAEEMGLELVQFEGGNPLYFLEGNRFTHEDGQPWQVMGMTTEESTLSLGDFWSTRIYPRFEEFGDPRAGTFPKPGIVEKYDGMTWAEFLADAGTSEAYLKIYEADNGAEIHTIGALAWMMSEIADQNWSETYYIKGGNDLLPKALADAVGTDNILLAHKVVKIEHREDSVTVTAEHAGADVTFTADFLVCALPFTTLRDVAIAPALSPDKAKAIAENFLMNSARGYVQTKTRFWEAEGLEGLKLAKTDTPAERVWNLSEVEPGEHGLIMSYTQNQHADALCKVAPAEREAYVLGHMKTFFPEIEAEKVAFVHHCWADDPWVKGAWTDILPGQWGFLDVARRPEGRIHFAGEHTSFWAGYMQGALESGRRAADEIVAAVG